MGERRHALKKTFGDPNITVSRVTRFSPSDFELVEVVPPGCVVVPLRDLRGALYAHPDSEGFRGYRDRLRNFVPDPEAELLPCEWCKEPAERVPPDVRPAVLEEVRCSNRSGGCPMSRRTFTPEEWARRAAPKADRGYCNHNANTPSHPDAISYRRCGNPLPCKDHGDH